MNIYLIRYVRERATNERNTVQRLVVVYFFAVTIAAFLCVLQPTPSIAQYSQEAFTLKQASDLYDERGFLQNKAIQVDGRIVVAPSTSTVSYSYPISSSVSRGYPVTVSLNYCGSVATTAFRDYNLAHELQFTPYSGWSKMSHNRPLWIIGVNGFAINVIASSTHFHPDTASKVFNPSATAFTDKDAHTLIDGYDFSNRMLDFNPVYNGVTGAYVDVIKILKEDGSLLELYNTNPRLPGDTTADKRQNLYTGYYTTNNANDRSYGIVEFDYSFWPDYIQQIINPLTTPGFRYPVTPRKLKFYPGTGEEIVFNEWVMPYGSGAYRDVESRSGGIWGGPTIFYLSAINSSAGPVLSFGRTRHYPFLGNPIFAPREDSTRGRALITSFEGHRISFGHHSLIIEALGRTTKIKFDSVLRAGTAEAWEAMPWANVGGMTPVAADLATLPEGDSRLYKSFTGYVTQIIDPENRVTSFTYEPTTRVYEDFNFPRQNPASGHQTLTMKGFRLKEVHEPDAKFVLKYRPAPAGNIRIGHLEPERTSDMCDTVLKVGTDGTLLAVDAYRQEAINEGSKLGIVTSEDKVSGAIKRTTYYYTHFALDQLSPVMTRGRHTAVTAVEVVAGDTVYTETPHRQGTDITGVSIDSDYLILPVETKVTVNGITRSRTTTSYTVDSLRTFGGKDALTQRHGLEVTRRVDRIHRPDSASVVLLTDTTIYKHFPQADTTVTWTERFWSKLKSLERYLALREAGDSRVAGKRWEDVSYEPFVAVIDSATFTERIKLPPLFGAVAATWRSDAAGRIGGTRSIYSEGILAGDYRTLRGLLVRDSILGRDSHSVLGHHYRYTAGPSSYLLTEKENAQGVITQYTYNGVWGHTDSLGIYHSEDDSAHVAILSNDDSSHMEPVKTGAFAYRYGVPIGERRIIRRYDEAGTLTSDTITTYTERTYHGLTSGERDASGWYRRYDYDRNGRIRTAWDAGDFPPAGVLDTVSYEGPQTIELYGLTRYNRRDDSLDCKRVNGILTSTLVPGTERTSEYRDTLFAWLPVTQQPPCPCKDDTAKTKDAEHDHDILATCDQMLYAPNHAGYKGYYGSLGYVMEADSPLKLAERIDSVYLELMVSSIYGGCVNFEVAVDTLLARTFVYNCGGPQNGERTKGDEEATILGDGSSFTPTAGGYLLRVNLTTIAPQLQAKTIGSTVTTTLRVKTVGGSVTLVSGSESQDMRPQLHVYGAYKRLADRADYTLAYEYDDQALTTTATAKIDDYAHTANRFDLLAMNDATIRRTSSLNLFGSDGRLLRSERTITENGMPRIDSVVNAYTGFGLRSSSKDEEGRVVRQRFDNAGRPIETTNSDSTRRVIEHRTGTPASFGITDQDFYGFIAATITTDETGTKQARFTDAFGRLRREVSDYGTGSGTSAMNLTTRHEYNSAGQLTAVISPKGDTTRYWYDGFGRVKYKHHPDVGTISYAYDDLGHIRFVQDEQQAEDNLIGFMQYDDAGRPAIIGEAFVAGFNCPTYFEDELYWQCPGDQLMADGEGDIEFETKTGRSGNGVASREERRRAKRREESRILTGGGDPYAGRLTNQLDGSRLQLGAEPSILTSNKTLLAPAIGASPSFAPLGSFVIAECPIIGVDARLGEVYQPVGPYIIHPAQFYRSAGVPGAKLDDFENITFYPEFVRIAIAYDSMPPSTGPVWERLPALSLWNQMAPAGTIRNLKGREAIVAYRDRSAEPYHYAAMSYDERGRVEALIRYTENIGFDAVYYRYNAMNEVIAVTVADALRQYTTWYGYDANGRLDSVWTKLGPVGSGLIQNGVVTSLAYPAPLTRPQQADITYGYTKTGQIAAMRYPPINVLVSYAYNRRAWLDSMVATGGGGDLFRQIFGYDSSGAITSVKWKHAGDIWKKQAYTYDGADRLTAWTNNAPTLDTTRYSYDKAGNRLAVTQSFVANPDNYTYHGGGAIGQGNRLWFRTRLDGSGGDTTISYSYDGNGAMMNRTRTRNTPTQTTVLGEEEYRYNYAGRMKRARMQNLALNTRADWFYRHSAAGEREQKRLYDLQLPDSTTGYGWAYYLLGGEGTQLALYHGQQGTAAWGCGMVGRRVHMYPVEYLSYGVKSTADVSTRPDKWAANGLKEYKLTDHLGSARVMLDGLGGIVSVRDYTPFGEVLGQPGIPMRRSYIDREIDVETGLGAYGARGYIPNEGRFGSVDPKWEKFRAYAPYHYSYNNPLIYSDGNGENPGNPLTERPADATEQVTDPGGGGGAWDDMDVGPKDPRQTVGPGAFGRLEFEKPVNGTKAIQHQGFGSHTTFKRVYGSAGKGMEWHHIVEQTPSNLSRYGAKTIHNTSNYVKLPVHIHRKISAFYSTKNPDLGNLTPRQWLSTKTYEVQRQFGLNVLKRFGINL